MFFPPKVFAVAFPLAIGVIGLLVIGNGTIFPPIFLMCSALDNKELN